MDNRPNLFIVGAPKCGTTAMYEYLRRHPQIFFSIAKEPHFFGRDLGYARTQLTEQKYLSYFAGAKEPWRGEASVFYLYSKESAREIQAFSPESKIIIMLRNPVDMLYSLHSQYLYNEREDIVDFQEALSAETDRRVGKRLPPHCVFVKGLFYRDVARYAPQVKRYVDIFGHQRVKVILYDEFKNRTADVYRDTLQFIGADPTFHIDMKVVNSNKQLRSKALRRFYADPPRLLRAAARLLVPQRTRYGALDRLRSLNARKVGRPVLPPEVRQKLAEEFRADVNELAVLIGRDLSHWKDCE